MELTAGNTYTGPTTVSSSILRLSNSAALPGDVGATSTGSNLTLDGGVLELDAGDFTRNLGTGRGQAQFTANGGGFSAVGANRVVNLNNSATLTWGSGSFLPDGAADARLGIGRFDDRFSKSARSARFGNGPQIVLVTAGCRGHAAVDAQLSGNLSGNGGLVVMGNGTLLLSGTDNTYGGGTAVDSGTLIVASDDALPDGSSLTVGGAGPCFPAGSVRAALCRERCCQRCRRSGAGNAGVRRSGNRCRAYSVAEEEDAQGEASGYGCGPFAPSRASWTNRNPRVIP